MAGELVGVEVDRPEVARRVAPRLIAEMARRRVAALAAGSDRPGAHPRPELDDRDEAVAAGAVPAARARIGTGGEGGEASPARPGEGDGDAGPAVVEILADRAVV